MDPVTHTFTGALVGRAGLEKVTPLGVATLVVAANIPDVDIVTYFGGEYAGLAYRRGWTHGLPAMAVWPLLVTGLILAWDRLVRLRRNPGAPPARAGPVAALALVGVLTHPCLDWLNTYGMRWLMPFDGRWSYGDAVFIVDPWLWLLLGGPLFLAHSRSWRSLTAWIVFWALSSLVVLSAPGVPAGAPILWGSGVVALAALRRTGAGRTGATRLARASGGVAVAYVLGMIALGAAGAGRVDRAARERGLEARDVMVGPDPADPSAWSFVVATADGYRRGSLVWRPGGARVSFEAAPVPRVEGVEAAVEIVAGAISASSALRHYLVWSRYPFYRVERAGEGFVVRVGDARYSSAPGEGGLGGPTVRLDAGLRVREPDGDT